MADLKAQLELSADASGVEAGINQAKRSINSLGVAVNASNSKASKSIDNYIKRLEQQRATLGMSAREAELYKLALRGASEAQLKAAESSLKLTEAYQNGAEIGDKINASFKAIGVGLATGLIAASVAFDQLVKKAGDFQDMDEKTGDSAENIASLAVAAGTAGVQMDTIVSASAKLTKSLTGVDDESKDAGAALAALGINIKDFKELKPSDQIEEIGKALNGFEDGAEKSAVAMALFGKSGAELLPFLKEIGSEGGRQVVLTQEQIQLADEYADRQAKLRTQISLHAQAIATEALPALNDFMEAIADFAKDQETAAIAADLMKEALSAGIVIFQTIAVLGSDVAFVFKGVGREIGAIAAQLNALAHLDFAGFSAISTAVKEDSARAREELDKFQARIMSIGMKTKNDGGLDVSGMVDQYLPDDEPGKKLKYAGAGDAKKDNAAKEAKAQLAFDLEQIKKESEAITNAYSNAEKIMQARRAANLIDDREYYAAKLGLIRLNSQEQESALQKELARLQKEKLTGKDKIDNDRKIADTQAKLAKVRAEAVSNIEVNSIQEEAANKKVAQSYMDAATAAQAYIDTIKRQNAREVEGIGRGEEFRANQAGRNRIEDKFTERRQELERDKRNGLIDQTQFDTYLAIAQDTYAKEIELYDQRTVAIKEKQGDWMNGASEAFANFQSNAENIAGNSAAMFTNAFEGMTEGVSSSISKAIVYGQNLEDSLKNVALNIADAFIASFIKIQIQKLFIDKTAAAGYATTIAAQSQAMVAMAGLNAFASTAAIPFVGPGLAPAAAAAATAVAEGFATAATAAALTSIAGTRALGGPVSAGQLYQVNERGPELLSTGGKQYLMMGDKGGHITPNNQLGAGGNSPITIVNQTSAKIGKVTERRLDNGERALILEEAVELVAAQMSDPNSKTSRALNRNFSVQRSR